MALPSDSIPVPWYHRSIFSKGYYDSVRAILKNAAVSSLIKHCYFGIRPNANCPICRNVSLILSHSINKCPESKKERRWCCGGDYK